MSDEAMTDAELEALLVHMQDQMHAGVEEVLADIRRIAGGGFDGSRFDRRLIETMAHVLISDHFSRLAGM